jgi:hypothetical protein
MTEKTAYRPTEQFNSGILVLPFQKVTPTKLPALPPKVGHATFHIEMLSIDLGSIVCAKLGSIEEENGYAFTKQRFPGNTLDAGR